MKNEELLDPTRPLSIAQWSVALPYGLLAQHHVGLQDSVEAKVPNIIDISHDEDKETRLVALDADRFVPSIKIKK